MQSSLGKLRFIRSDLEMVKSSAATLGFLHLARMGELIRTNIFALNISWSILLLRPEQSTPAVEKTLSQEVDEAGMRSVLRAASLSP